MKNIKILYVLTFLTFFSIKAQENTKPKGFWGIPDTPIIFKIGGYVKLDAIHDFDNISQPDFFDVSKIATDGSKREATNFNAKESRILFDFRIPDKDIRTYFEGDFYGTNGAFRLRHAYVTYKGWLAGQTWSNFMDESMGLETLDFEKPLAYAFARHAILRYKHSLSDSSYISVALEQPKAEGEDPTNNGTSSPEKAGNFQSPLPDLTARYRITKKWGHVQLSGFLASVRYQYDTGNKDDVTQYGGNLSTKLNLGKNTNFIGQVIYGNGITRYRGGNSVGLDEKGKFKSIKEFAFTVGLQQKWSPKVTSFILYNNGDLDTTAGQSGSDIAKTYYYALNTIYNLTPTTSIGLEYLKGRRENIDGSNGEANRLQFSFKQSINL